MACHIIYNNMACHIIFMQIEYSPYSYSHNELDITGSRQYDVTAYTTQSNNHCIHVNIINYVSHIHIVSRQCEMRAMAMQWNNHSICMHIMNCILHISI